MSKKFVSNILTELNVHEKVNSSKGGKQKERIKKRDEQTEKGRNKGKEKERKTDGSIYIHIYIWRDLDRWFGFVKFGLFLLCELFNAKSCLYIYYIRFAS